MGLLKPNQVLNKAYRQVAIETTDFDLFKNALRTLRDNIVDGQREHTQKEHLRNFLSETFYKPYYMAPEEDIDLAIRLDKTIWTTLQNDADGADFQSVEIGMIACVQGDCSGFQGGKGKGKLPSPVNSFHFVLRIKADPANTEIPVPEGTVVLSRGIHIHQRGVSLLLIAQKFRSPPSDSNFVVHIWHKGIR